MKPEMDANAVRKMTRKEGLSLDKVVMDTVGLRSFDEDESCEYMSREEVYEAAAEGELDVFLSLSTRVCWVFSGSLSKRPSIMSGVERGRRRFDV